MVIIKACVSIGDFVWLTMTIAVAQRRFVMGGFKDNIRGDGRRRWDHRCVAMETGTCHRYVLVVMGHGDTTRTMLSTLVVFEC